MTLDPTPTITVLRDILTDMIVGRRSREEVARRERRTLDAGDFSHERTLDLVLFLADADRPGSETSPYRYGQEDFLDRLDDLLDPNFD